MGAYKDFDAARAEKADIGELRFLLAGREFTTRTTLPALPLLNMSALTEESTNVEAMRVLTDLLLAIVVETEQMRAALGEVNFETVFRVAAWIVEEVTGRPLESASPSLAPVSWTSDTPRVASLSAVSTPSP